MYFLTTILNRLHGKNRLLYNAALIAALLALSSCSSAPLVTQIPVAVEVKSPKKVHLPKPPPIKAQKISWKVLTSRTLPDDLNWVYFALTPDDYEKLSLTQADILRWVKEAYWRIETNKAKNSERR